GWSSGAERNHAGHRIPEWLSLPAARSRQEVLPRVPGDTCGRRCEVHAHSGEKSEFECPRGTLGPLHQGGMSIEADFVWGEIVAARRVRFPSILTKKETTKAKTISCSSRSLLRVRWVRKARSAVVSGSVAYSNTTAAPHEYFDQTGIGQ